MMSLIQGGGVLAMVGGLGLLWSGMLMRRRGMAWRGPTLMGAASALYGVLALAGVIFPSSVQGAVLVCIIAALIVAAFVMIVRDARTVKAHELD